MSANKQRIKSTSFFNNTNTVSQIRVDEYLKTERKQTTITDEQIEQDICISCQCSNCSKIIFSLRKKIQNLEKEIFRLEKKNTQLEYISTFKAMSLQKRDQMMTKVLEKLRDETGKSNELGKQINKMKERNEEQKEFTNQLLGGVDYYINGQNYSEKQIQFKFQRRITGRNMQHLLGQENTKRFITKSLNVIHNKKYDQQQDYFKQEFQDLDQLIKKKPKVTTVLSEDKKHSTTVMLKRSSGQGSGLGNTVSTWQGNRPETSFFTDQIGKFSFFQIKEKEKAQVIDKLNFLEELFSDEKDITIRLEQLNPLQQRQVGVHLQFLIKDLKHFVNIGWRLKQLIKVTTEMLRNTNLQDTYNSIIHLTCSYLKCDRTSIFILDKTKNILWTKAQKSTLMIEVPIDKGIVGYSVVNNIKINVPDAYKDERFNQQIDKQTGYKTKSLLVIPILDEKGVVVGAVQAINKDEGQFNDDDEDLLTLIAQYSGGILKNSLVFEDMVLKLQRMKKLLELAMQLYQFNDVYEVINFAQINIIEMMNVTRCVICIIKRHNHNQFLQKYSLRTDSKLGVQVIVSDTFQVTEKNSLITKVLYDRETIYLRNPRGSPDYNPQQDIDTTLSLITLPVLSQMDERVLAIIQVETVKGFVSAALGTFKEDDLELLQLFSRIIGSFFQFKFQKEF